MALRDALPERTALARLLDFWTPLGFEAPLDLLAALPLLRGLDFALADLPLAEPPLAGPAVLPLVWLPLVELAVLPLAGPPGDLLTGVVPRSLLFAISDNRPCYSDLPSAPVAECSCRALFAVLSCCRLGSSSLQERSRPASHSLCSPDSPQAFGTTGLD